MKPIAASQTAIYVINLTLMILLFRFEINSGSDKTLVITTLGIIVLIVLNGLMGFFAYLDKNRIYRPFWYSALGLLVGYILFIAGLLSPMGY